MIDWKNKEYRSIPRNTLIQLLIALIILVFPFDLPGIADDILTLVFMVCNGVSLDLEDYRQWKIRTACSTMK